MSRAPEGAFRRTVKLPMMVAALLGLWLALPAQASAQRVDAELSGGASIGNYTDTDAGLDVLPGPSFGVRVELWPVSTLAGYVGFTRSSFGCEEGFCTDRDVSLTTQGLVLGGRWSPGLPWVRAGLAVHTLDIEAAGADDDLDPGLGFEVAAGVDVGLGQTIRIRPGLKYLRHDASTDLGEGHVALLALEVGVAVSIAEF